MGKARDWALVVFIGVAWSEGAWAQSCGDTDHPGPVCVDGLDYDSLHTLGSHGLECVRGGGLRG